MAEHGTAVLEETVADLLLDDLAAVGAPSHETRGIRP
jgi:hypothetical protein